MLNKSLDNEEILDEKYKISIEVEDITEDGKPALLLDVKINGLSVGRGEIEYELLYDRNFEEMPQSLRFLSAILSGIGGNID